LFQSAKTNCTFFPVAEIVAKSARLESTFARLPFRPDYPYLAKFVEPNFSFGPDAFHCFYTHHQVLTNPKLGFPLIPNLSLFDLFPKAGFSSSSF
jgi:phenylalanine-4-hydroxylase